MYGPESSRSSTIEVDAGSFRDPSGFVFRSDGVLYRQVNHSYAADYDRLMRSGLYEELVSERLLIPHSEVDGVARTETGYKTLRPELVSFISYPQEWCFGQLRDAAVLTLEIERRALDHGMTLKDASAYNVQFHRGQAVLIDSLSFESYEEGQPWVAYRQFCQHFLAPLLLWARVDARTSGLLRSHLDGIPLDLASKMLPRVSWLRFGELVHVHLHARSLIRHRNTTKPASSVTGIGESARRGLIDSLMRAVSRLSWEPGGTEWADYESDNSYTRQQESEKCRLVEDYLQQTTDSPSVVWDIGANTGEYSTIAARLGHDVIAFDKDPAAVEIHYRRRRAEANGKVLPLIQDLTNPSAAIGWANRERSSLQGRGPADVLLALALIHHLAIGGNVPLRAIVEYFASLARAAIIEFVPKEDPQCQRLLASRADIFPDYTQARFEAEFAHRFVLARRMPIADSGRCLYLFERLSQ